MEDNSELLMKYQKLAHEYSKVSILFDRILIFFRISIMID